MGSLVPLYIVIALLGTACALVYSKLYDYLRCRKISQKIFAGALVVDVREQEEYKAGHYAKAINIPYQQITKSLHKLGHRDMPIVVYCHSGSRSKQACRDLKQLGFNNVIYARSARDFAMYKTSLPFSKKK